MNLRIKKELQFFDLNNGLFHVYDPIAVKHFKIGEKQVEWLKLLDGNKSKEELKQWIPEDLFEQFFEQVEALGLLEGAQNKEKFDIFKIKFRLLNVNEILSKTMGFNIVYRKVLNWTSIFFMLASMVLVVKDIHAITEMDYIHAVDYTYIIYYIISMAVVGFFHEISHAISAKSYGVNVTAIGVMLIYLQPAFYTDISGVNLLPNKIDRVKVLLAGVMANGVLAFIGMAVFHFTHQLSPQIAIPALLFAGLNGTLMMMNVLPFVEYDGFFVLNTLFEEGNFKNNSMIYVANFFKEKAYHNLKPEYLFYFIFSRFFTVSLVTMAILTARSYVIGIVENPYLDYAFLGLIIAMSILVMQRDFRRAV